MYFTFVTFPDRGTIEFAERLILYPDIDIVQKIRFRRLVKLLFPVLLNIVFCREKAATIEAIYITRIVFCTTVNTCDYICFSNR